MQLVKITTPQHREPLIGIILKYQNVSTVHGTLPEMTIVPCDSSWAGTITLSFHGDYGTYKFNEVEVVGLVSDDEFATISSRTGRWLWPNIPNVPRNI